MSDPVVACTVAAVTNGRVLVPWAVLMIVTCPVCGAELARRMARLDAPAATLYTDADLDVWHVHWCPP